MNERIEELMIDYLNGNLSDQDRVEWEDLMDINHVKKDDIEDYQAIYSGLEEIGQRDPSAEMSTNFYTMLNDRISKSNRYTILDQFATFLYQKEFSRGGIQAAYSALVLIIGLGVGYLLMGKSDRGEIQKLSSEVREMKSMMMLNLLEKESPSARIKAVALTNEMIDISEVVIKALFTTLNSDKNTNVRLEAIDALVRYTEKPEVRLGLIQSLGNQTNPLVQLALADIMVLLQDKEGKSALGNLMNRDELPDDVKDLIKERYNAINI